jgi:hypothetical protein
MTTNGHGRRDVDGLLVAALATGASHDEAGRSAGVSKTTVKRRMASEKFRRAVAEERLEVVETVRGRLVGAAPSASRL